MKHGVLVLAWLAAVTPVVAQRSTSCITCHSDADLFEAEQLAIIDAYRGDVHAEVGLSCHDCHGGNPAMAVADDMFAAKDDSFAANPYRGQPDRTEIPGFCGECHSNPTYMRRFKPDARVDQEQEYWTSQHGVALQQGDTRVATCIECHGIHGIVRADSPRSPVYPRQLAETCRSCHADPDWMAGYVTPAGKPLAIDQYARWRASVHAEALLEREDLSAPTCNDCHGNHGAAPPGLASVNFVCGQCHGREASLFRQSAKREGQDEHNEFLAGAESCADCHAEPEPAAAITGITSFSECATCHGNHGIVRANVTLLSPLPETPCAFCHEAPPGVEQLDEPNGVARNYARTRDALLAEAAEAGLAGDELFDWLVDHSLVLEFHTLEGGGDGDVALRPEFARLFQKFRIGKTHYTYPDPAGEGEVRQRLRRCSDCHAAEPELADEAAGHATSHWLRDRMRELTVHIARAERTLLAAHRGGVELGEAPLQLDLAVDAEVALEVLVHAFSDDPEGEFAQRHAEGLQFADNATIAGREALGELRYRRAGLGVSLIVIVLVLIALALKIREMGRQSRREAEEAG